MSILFTPGHVDFPGSAGNYLSIPDAAPLDIVGDLCIVARIALDDWTPAGINCVLSKWSIANSYLLYLNSATARPWLFWNDGALQNAVATATIPGLVDGGWKWLAVTLDVNNGAAGRDIRFWYGDDGVTWVQLGTTVTQAGTTSIVASASPLDIGTITGVNNLAGLIQHLSIANGIGAGGTVGGTEVFRYAAAIDLIDVDVDASAFTATTGQTVTVNRSGSPTTTIVPTVLEYVDDVEPAATVYSMDLCLNWARIGQLQQSAFEFRGVQRQLDFGEWMCSFPEGEPSWSSYLNADSEYVSYGPEDVDSIRLIGDNRVEYAGYVVEHSTGSGGIERTVTADGIVWTLSGVDLWDVLRRRVALPNPAVESGWAVAYDDRAGIASTVLAGYLSDNAGVTALAAFQVDGFAVVDTVAGLPGTWSARLQPLDELTKRICTEGGIVCRLTSTFAGDVIASLEQPRDLSETFVLSDQGDLINIHTRLVPVRSNYVIAGGAGTGTSRVFRSASDGTTGTARRVVFSDQSSLSSAGELQASANATLRLDAETWSVSADVSDTAAGRLPFGTDILIGDSIAVEVNGRRHTVPVAAITWTINADRQVVTPTLGMAVPDRTKGLIRDVGDLQSRFDNNVA